MTAMPLHTRQIGTSGAILLLLHGLSANGNVWEKLLDGITWPGRILVPDLRGHGSSPHAGSYSLQDHAEDVAALLNPGDEIYILGHSMGGVLGLVLGGRSFDIGIRSVFAFATKPKWTEDELAGVRRYAEQPRKIFATEEEAAQRFIKASGLSGLVISKDSVVQAGIKREEDVYGLAADPRTVLVAGDPLNSQFCACCAEKRLACGTKDSLANLADLREIDPQAIDLGPFGHNVHVESPEELVKRVPFLA
jgi:pimeloyl-ACP methyl ester carboxylesterase